MPKNFPVCLNEFLRLVVGGKYKQKRHDTFRAYLCASNPKSTPTEIDSIMERYETKGISYGWFIEVRPNFLAWLAQRRTEKARKAATKRWSQKRRKESRLKRTEKCAASLDKEKSQKPPSSIRETTF
jgi:hypothetical protein